MSRLPVVSGREMVRYLERKGFFMARQRGSHVLMKSPDGHRVTVPLHPELGRGTLLAILSEAGIERKEFVEEWR
jgi:predicted RNA binding protein YcfA (HicA-like mRNA interferase family)